MAAHDWILDKSGELVYVCSRCGGREHIFREQRERDEVRQVPVVVLEDCDEAIVKKVLEE